MNYHKIFPKNTIRKKFGLIFCFLIILISINAFILISINNLSKTDAKVINISGRQRMLSQRIAKESLIVIQTNGTDESDIAQLESSMFLFNISHLGLRYGSESLNLSETFSQNAIEQWEIVDALWKEFAEIIEKVYTNDFNSTLTDNIVEKNVPLLLEIDELVTILEFEATQKNQVAFFTQIISWIIIMIVLIVSLIYIIEIISKPIQILTAQATLVAQGNLEEDLVNYESRKDEIGVLEKQFLIMQKQIQKMINSLEEKVETLESFLPICARCKKIRLESDEWVQIETHITNKTGTLFSHGLCPSCEEFYMQDLPE